MFFGHAAQGPQCSLQTGGQGHEALARVDDGDMAPAGIRQCKLVQAVSKHHAGNLHVQLIRHGEVRDTLASWRVLLGKVDLPFGSKLGSP